MILSGTFSAVNNKSIPFLLRRGERAQITLTNTGGHTWAVNLEQLLDGGPANLIQTVTTDQVGTYYLNPAATDILVQVRCTVLDALDSIAYTLNDTIPVGAHNILSEAPAKAGTTAGWVVGAADNLGKIATLPKNITSGTLVLRLDRLKVGDKICGAYLVGSAQAATAKATALTFDVRMLTAAAAGATDSSLGAMSAPLSVTANTVLSASNTLVQGVDHVIVAGESFYVLVTGTTFNDNACTAELQAIGVFVVPAA